MYSTEFIREVKEVYPNAPDMHRLADQGAYGLGRYLDDSSQGGLSVDTILLATSLEKLQQEARIMKRKNEVYSRWYEETQPEREKLWAKQ